MYMGIEIGGTKLQFGIGTGDDPVLRDVIRKNIDISQGGEGIRNQIKEVVPQLLDEHDIQKIGIGFGGPVDGNTGVTLISHQVHGWENFPLKEWTESQFHKPVSVGNDCDVAALGEAVLGGGRNAKSVFYITVGTGVGGGYIVNQKLQGRGRPAMAEIGHLRPSLSAVSTHETVESWASGLGLLTRWKTCLKDSLTPKQLDEYLNKLNKPFNQLSTYDLIKMINEQCLISQYIWNRGVQHLGWGIAQMLTLLSAEVVIIGGGMSQALPEKFWKQLEQYVRMYCFPPLVNSFRIVPASLGDEVVLYGAILLSQESTSEFPN